MLLDRGSINLIEYKGSRGVRFHGDTLRDSLNLRDCGCPMYFGEEEYDEVLRKVSVMGFDLAVPILD